MSSEEKQAVPAVKLASLSAAIQAAAQRANWPELTPVQAQAIPYLLGKQDLMAQARTGSGKTGAFLLPMLDRLDPQKKSAQALILVPTRELAKQVDEEAQTLFKDSGLSSVPVYGGVGYGHQIDAFKSGTQLIVGTPGRILDHLIKGNLKLDAVQMLIFDEADRMLSMGFYPDMLDIQSHLPRNHVGGYMFSATFPPNVQRLATRFLNDAEFISLSQDHIHVTDVAHIAMEAPRMDKDRALVRLIEVENPDQALIFCNTKSRVAYVATVLRRFGFQAAELSSDLSQGARERVLKQLADQSLRFLVATDVAARGIDIPALSHVIIYELPDDHEQYIHRAGRTGRAGKGGVAITLFIRDERRELNKVASIYKIKFNEVSAPDEEEVASVVAQRLTAKLEAELRGRDKLKTERMQRFRSLASELAESQSGEALLAMLLDDHYHAATHGKLDPVPQQKKSPPTSKKNNRGQSNKKRNNYRNRK